MFHKSNLGSFGENLPCDINGFVPEAGDDAEEFNFGDDRFTNDFDAQGNGYEGYADDAWSEFVDQAVDATKAALAALNEWRTAKA